MITEHLEFLGLSGIFRRDEPFDDIVYIITEVRNDSCRLYHLRDRSQLFTIAKGFKVREWMQKYGASFETSGKNMLR